MVKQITHCSKRAPTSYHPADFRRLNIAARIAKSNRGFPPAMPMVIVKNALQPVIIAKHLVSVFIASDAVGIQHNQIAVFQCNLAFFQIFIENTAAIQSPNQCRRAWKSSCRHRREPALGCDRRGKGEPARFRIENAVGHRHKMWRSVFVKQLLFSSTSNLARRVMRLVSAASSLYFAM